MADSILLLCRDRYRRVETTFALSQAGFGVVGVTDHSEALRKLEGFKPSLAIMDDDLSTIEDLEVYFQLHQVLRVPVVMLGYSPDSEGWAKVNEIEADLYVRKPVGYQELVARIKAILRRYRREEEAPRYVSAASPAP